VPRQAFTFCSLKKKKKKKKFKTKRQKPSPRSPFSFPPIFFLLPIFFLPPSHGFSPTGTGVTPLLFLLSVCIEMEAKKTQIQRTQAPKTHLCARSAKRWKERVGGCFGCRRQHRHRWFHARQSSLPFSGSAVELLPHREFYYFVPVQHSN
jgi:hypothetical protein